MVIKELREKQKRLITEARSKFDEIKDDTPEARAKELESAHDAAMAEFDKLEERIKREEALIEREAALETDPDPRRPKGENRRHKPGDDLPEARDQNAVFKHLLQYGFNGMPAEDRSTAEGLVAGVTPEMRALGISSPATGGFTVPQGFSGEIDRASFAWGPMLGDDVARVFPTDSGNALPWPTMNDTGNTGRRIAENAANADLDVVFNSVTVNAHMYTSDVIKVPYQLLMDSAFDVQSEIIKPAFDERIGRIVNLELTVGTGVSQPTGIVTGSGLGKTTAAIAAVTPDDVLDFYHSIDPAYRGAPKFKFMFNDSTLLAMRKLKDAQNRYMIDDLKNDKSVLNLGGISVPYVINQAVASMATGARFMVGGDFSRYIVRRVRDYQLLVARELYMANYQVGFFGFARYDGQMLNNSAIKHMKNA